MIMSLTSSSLSLLGPRSRSHWLFLEKKQHFHHCSHFIYGPVLTLLHTTVNYDNILDKNEYKHSTGSERTVHMSRCPVLYSGRIFVPLCRELIIFVF